MSKSINLTQQDVSRFMQDRSAVGQIAVIEKITGLYTDEDDQGFSGKESGIANDIFNLLLNRAELQVRTILAESLSKTVKLPCELALKMAMDVAEVAAPVLEHSTVLADDDLLGMIHGDADEHKLQAIARRKTVSETVSDALVDTKVETVVNTLVKNEGAEIADQTFIKISDNHGDNAEIIGALFSHESMPVAVVEKIMDNLSHTMRKQMEQKFGDLSELREVKSKLELSLELTGLKMMGLNASDQEMARIMSHLEGDGKLSLFFALSMGELELFQVKMARMLRTPLKKIQALMQDKGQFKEAYLRAKMPESMFDATDITVRAIQDLEQESMQKIGVKQKIAPNHLIERIQRLSEGKEVEGLSYFFAIMRHSSNRAVPQAQAS